MPSTPSERDVLPVLEQLIRIPSVNPALCPQEGSGESEIARFASAWLAERGLESRLEEAAPGRPNVVAECGRGDGPRLVLCAHLDTVGTAGMTIPAFEPRLEQGRVYGRGSYDMKGSVAAVMVAAAALAEERLPGRLLVALVADEEHASEGARQFVGHHRADACILTEPSEGRLIVAHKGFIWIEIETSGVAAHGSRWELGVSAISRMARVVSALERFDTEVLRGRSHELLGPASQHCSMIEGGSGLSTYAERCSLKLERRTLPGETPEAALEEVREVIRGTGVEARAELVLARPPLECPPDSRVAECVRAAATAVAGSAPAVGGVAYWMDAALFAEAGIATVNYGPSGAGAHAAVEWVELASVASCARVLVDASRRFLAAGRGALGAER